MSPSSITSLLRFAGVIGVSKSESKSDSGGRVAGAMVELRRLWPNESAISR